MKKNTTATATTATATTATATKATAAEIRAAADQNGLPDVLATIRKNVAEKSPRPISKKMFAAYGKLGAETFDAFAAAELAAQSRLQDYFAVLPSGVRDVINAKRAAAVDAIAHVFESFVQERAAFEARFKPSTKAESVNHAAARELFEYMLNGSVKFAKAEIVTAYALEPTKAAPATFRRAFEFSIVAFIDSAVFADAAAVDALRKRKADERKRKAAERAAKDTARAEEIAATIGIDYGDKEGEKLAWRYLNAEKAAANAERAASRADDIKTAAKLSDEQKKLLRKLHAAEKAAAEKSSAA